MIFGGRQAIDGDTTGWSSGSRKISDPQVTYAEALGEIKDKIIVIKRRLEKGKTVSAQMPLVITVNGTAPECRPRNAKKMMKYKRQDYFRNE